MSEKAQLIIDGKTIELPIVTGTENEKAIDISSLRGSTGYITIDPSVSMNPTIIGYFGSHMLKEIIPSNSVKEIIFEGIYLLKESKVLNEINRIMKSSNFKINYNEENSDITIYTDD